MSGYSNKQDGTGTGDRSEGTGDMDSITKTKNFLQFYDRVIGTFYYEEMAKQLVPSEERATQSNKQSRKTENWDKESKSKTITTENSIGYN